MVQQKGLNIAFDIVGSNMKYTDTVRRRLRQRGSRCRRPYRWNALNTGSPSQKTNLDSTARLLVPEAVEYLMSSKDLKVSIAYDV